MIPVVIGFRFHSLYIKVCEIFGSPKLSIFPKYGKFIIKHAIIKGIKIILTNVILFVVFTERKGDVIRIISARRATLAEEEEYYENYDIR